MNNDPMLAVMGRRHEWQAIHKMLLMASIRIRAKGQKEDIRQLLIEGERILQVVACIAQSEG